jgi:hypothetical protein
MRKRSGNGTGGITSSKTAGARDMTGNAVKSKKQFEIKPLSAEAREFEPLPPTII